MGNTAEVDGTESKILKDCMDMQYCSSEMIGIFVQYCLCMKEGKVPKRLVESMNASFI